jgi:hypothetical protein
MPIQNIAPIHLAGIADIVRNYTPELEKKITKNLGVVSLDGAGRVNGFSLYKPHNAKALHVFALDGTTDGIKDIVNYYMQRTGVYLQSMPPGIKATARRNIFIEVPLDRRDVLNVLKDIKQNGQQLFSFSSNGNLVTATWPPEDAKDGSFKKFIQGKEEKAKKPKPPVNQNDDEYGLFKDMPWSDQ